MGVGLKTRAWLLALGIDPPTLSPPCEMCDADHAARIHGGSGFWQYRCDVRQQSVGLAELRAFRAYGEWRSRLSPAEAARWRDRLDYDAGLRKPIRFSGELPEGCPASARIVLAHMCLLVGLRESVADDPEARRFPLDEPFVFARPFAVAYTGLDWEQVRYGVEWLEQAEAIRRVGKSGRAILWKLAAQDALPPLTALLAGGDRGRS